MPKVKITFKFLWIHVKLSRPVSSVKLITSPWEYFFRGFWRDRHWILKVNLFLFSNKNSTIHLFIKRLHFNLQVWMFFIEKKKKKNLHSNIFNIPVSFKLFARKNSLLGIECLFQNIRGFRALKADSGLLVNRIV